MARALSDAADELIDHGGADIRSAPAASAASSEGDCGRSAGFLANARLTTASSSSGSSGRRARIDGGSAERCAYIFAAGVASGYGTSPVSAS
jgi:hypothetical protein